MRGERLVGGKGEKSFEILNNDDGFLNLGDLREQI